MKSLTCIQKIEACLNVIYDVLAASAFRSARNMQSNVIKKPNRKEITNESRNHVIAAL